MENTLLDNSERFRLVDCLRSLISDERCTYIRIATGYWDLPGTDLARNELEHFLQRGGRLDLLIGQEPQLRSYQLDSSQYDTNRFPDFYIQRDINRLSDSFQPIAQLLLRYCTFEDEESSSIRIRIYGQSDEEKQFLHAKCYIFTGSAFGHGIIGSSNFTQKGLEDNAELNYLECDSRLVAAQMDEIIQKKSHLVWFNELWEKSTPWNGIFIKDILQKAPVAKNIKREEPDTSHLSPYEVYIKYLQTQFGDIADASVTAQLNSYLPQDINSLSYQLDAVKQSFYILKRYGGFILADVVGLGKTIVGILIIKKFLEEANLYNRTPKVLIITPPAIQKSWTDTITLFDKDASNKIREKIEFVTTGSINGLSDNTEIDEENGLDNSDENVAFSYSDYGMIMIDESHNFRNSDTNKYRALDNLIDEIESRTGYVPFIGLLSATPQNNSPRDLKNQICLFERTPNNSRFSDVEGGKLDSFFAEKQREFDACRNSNSMKAQNSLKRLATEIREKVLDHILVRRTRTDIKKLYSEDAKMLRFPTIKGPNKLEYSMNPKVAELFMDTIDIILPPQDGTLSMNPHIGYYRYCAILFLRDEMVRKSYENRNLTVDTITERLAKIMQILLVKRLESSFDAFRHSLQNLLQYTKNMLTMLDEDCVFICPDLDVNAIFKKFDFNFPDIQAYIREKIKKKKRNNKEFHASDFTENYRKKLLEDVKIIDDLCKRWNDCHSDPKFERFIVKLETDLFNPAINNPHHYDKPRLVIFTEAIDTQKKLADYISEHGHNVLSISANNRADLQETIRRNFDANCPKNEQLDDYDVIVTTEVLAEGVNLHRANVILNYDTPWNATRLMQRIGRVNRLGSKEDFVHVFNFYPDKRSNAQIRLNEKAYAKLQAFHTLFGEDNKVYSEEEELTEVDFNRQFDGEESPCAVYIADLKEYQKKHPERYKFIKQQEMNDLGGVLPRTDGNALFYIMAEKHSGLAVQIDSSDQVSLLPPLSFMQKLKCDENAIYAGEKDLNRISQLTDWAKSEFEQSVYRSLRGNDSRKRINEAIKIASELAKKLHTQEAKEAIRKADRAVRAGNKHAIRMLEKYKANEDAGQMSLWGEDFDIEMWVASMFANIKTQNKVQYGETYLAIYNI